jgi:GTP-binding protein
LLLREHWKAFIEGYFQTRQALSGLVVVMDSRHPLKPFDRQMLDFAFRRGLACHVLLTKADKLTRSARAQALAEVRKALEGRASVQLFSAPEQLGVEEARAVVAGWLGLGAAAPAKGG